MVCYYWQKAVKTIPKFKYMHKEFLHWCYCLWVRSHFAFTECVNFVTCLLRSGRFQRWKFWSKCTLAFRFFFYPSALSSWVLALEEVPACKNTKLEVHTKYSYAYCCAWLLKVQWLWDCLHGVMGCQGISERLVIGVKLYVDNDGDKN